MSFTGDIFLKNDSYLIDGNVVTAEKKRKHEPVAIDLTNLELKKYSYSEKKESERILFNKEIKKQRTETVLNSLHLDVKDSEKIKFDKVVVVEVYSNFKNIDSPAAKYEIIGNFESGTNLIKKFHPEVRYIWSINKNVTESVLSYADSEKCNAKTINLAEEDFSINCGRNSKLIVVGQGNLEENKIADLSSEEFIDSFLIDDLEVKSLSEIELHVCNIGKDEEYINQIQEYFKCETRIIAYSSLIATNQTSETVAFDEEGEVIDLSLAQIFRKSV
jgi:hypothetical protein